MVNISLDSDSATQNAIGQCIIDHNVLWEAAMLRTQLVVLMVKHRVEVQLDKPTGQPVGKEGEEEVEDASVHILIKGTSIAADTVKDPRASSSGQVHLRTTKLCLVIFNKKN